MKTKVDDLFQYHILLDGDDMDRFKKKGAISIDTHRDIPGLPFIHIIAPKGLRDEEFDRGTALMVLKAIVGCMYPGNDLFGNKTLIINRDDFESVRKKFLDRHKELRDEE